MHDIFKYEKHILFILHEKYVNNVEGVKNKTCEEYLCYIIKAYKNICCIYEHKLNIYIFHML